MCAAERAFALSVVAVTRRHLLDLPVRLATPNQPQFAREVWLVPIKTETMVISVNVTEAPSHHIVAYAKTIDLVMHKDMVHLATEQLNGRTPVTRLWLPTGGFVVTNSAAVTMIHAYRDS